MSDGLRSAVEALLFASEKPLSVDEIKNAFEDGVSAGDIQASLELLKQDYEAQERGFQLAQIAGGFQIVTHPRFASYLKKFYQAREKKRLSQAALETLSVIAYKQPVTRADIEAIRGVNVDGAIKSLMEKDLIRMVGRKEVPGRPILYGTTRDFLERFGINSLKELPPLSEFTEKDLDQNLLPPQLKAERTQSHGEGLADEKGDLTPPHGTASGEGDT